MTTANERLLNELDPMGIDEWCLGDTEGEWVAYFDADVFFCIERKRLMVAYMVVLDLPHTIDTIMRAVLPCDSADDLPHYLVDRVVDIAVDQGVELEWDWVDECRELWSDHMKYLEQQYNLTPAAD